MSTTRSWIALTAILVLGIAPSAIPVNGLEATAAEVGTGACVQTVGSSSGVDVSQDGTACVVQFKSVGSNSWTAPAGVNSISAVIVGGGGGGGAWTGAGGGAGGVVAYGDVFETLSATSALTVTAGTTYDVTVGDGGAGAVFSGTSASNFTPGENGDPSEFGGLIAYGGGVGASWSGSSPQQFANGGSATIGSGGGATDSSDASNVVGEGNSDSFTAVGGRGKDGGKSTFSQNQPHPAGGGGGAGETGRNPPDTETSGAGGKGVEISITGSATWIAGGGGGGIHGTGADETAGTVGAGGLGGGGAGSGPQRVDWTGENVGDTPVGQAGSDNTGGGGGGAGHNSGSADHISTGGKGGSGVVILRYSLNPGPPTSTSISSGDGKFTLGFTAPTYTGGGTLAIQYELDNSGTWVDLDATTGPEDVTANNSTVYSVKLRSKNTVGGSDYFSSEVDLGDVIPSSVGEILRFDATNPDSFDNDPNGDGDTSDSDTSWADIAGSRTGTLQGDAQFNARKKAFDLDGTGDYISVGNIATDFSSGLAIHAVVDFGDAVDYEGVLELTDGDNQAGNIAFGRYGTEDTLWLEVTVGGTPATCYSRNDAIQEGFHAYSVIVATDGSCTFKRDGVTLNANQDSSAQLPSLTLRDTNYVGARRGAANPLNGSIQSVIVYNTAQTTPTCVPFTDSYTGDGTAGDSGVPYTYASFTTAGECTWTIPSGVTLVDYLVVAGGGGGGHDEGGGGGAGGFLTGADLSVDAGASVTVKVGIGGAGSPTGIAQDGSETLASNGGDSVFSTVTADGGGGGGDAINTPNGGEDGASGGSGGGGAGENRGGIGGSGTAGQGSEGSVGGSVAGGGGGGAGSAATNSRQGGSGESSALTGSTVIYAAGGGGGVGNSSTTGGGSGGDASAGTGGDTDTAPGYGASNSGSGGGGGGGSQGTNVGNEYAGGDGGSGIVVVRYSRAPAMAISSVTPTTGSLTVNLATPTHTAGSAVTGYEIQWSTNSNFTGATTIDPATTSQAISDLTDGSTYYIRARATNANGTGEWSATSTGVPVAGTDHYLSFDGTDDYGSVSGQIISDGDNYTVEAWVYDEALANGDHGILRIGSTNRIFIMTRKATGSNRVILGINGTGTHQDTYFDLPQNQWVHVALVRDGSDWDFYMNGSLVKSGSVSASSFDTGGLLVGAASGSGTFWDGRIDQVKIWDYTMSASQIQQSMHVHKQSGVTGAGAGGATAPDLISHYDFNVVDASAVGDQVGSNDLALNGSLATSDYADLAEVSTASGQRTISFPRSYLTGLGGYTLASGVDDVTAVVVGGGGGGGSDSGSGGGGGARIEADIDLGSEDAPVVSVRVGQGGLGGSWSSDSLTDEMVWATSGYSSQATITDSSANALSLTAAGGEGGSNNASGSTLNNSGANDGTGAVIPSNPSDSSTSMSSSNVTKVAGGNGGAARSGGYTSKGNGNNGSGGGTSTVLSVAFGGGGGGGASGEGYSGGSGVNGGGSGATTAVHATAGTANRGGGGGAGSAYGATTPKFPNTRDGFMGGSGFVALKYEVVSAPTISSHPSDADIQADANTSFSVTASVTSGSLTYQWQVSTNSGGTWSDIDGATTSTLSLTSVPVSSNLNQYRVITTNTVNGESATTTSNVATLGVEDGATVVGAICDGSYTKNSLTVEAGHGEVFYIDTGQGQEIDAGYIAYVVESDNARSDLWVEVTDFTGGTVSLANPDASTQPLGSVAAGGTDTAFFMIKATGATTTAQSHVVNVYDQKPSIGSPQPIYSCGYSFVEVAETIKAAANKVDSITSTSVSSLGSTMTITVQGDTGTIGQGNDIDGRMIWVTPAARSDWPTDALRLESTSISFYSDSNRRNLLTSHADTLRVNSSTTPALDSSRRQYYTATYTFRVIGAAASTAPIIPIAMISSGTQVKHTDVGSLPTGGSATVDVTEPDIDLSVTKSVDSATSVNSDGTTTLSYEITLTNGGSNALVIDEVVDTPDSSVTLVSGSATYAGVSISDPEATGSSSLAFSGPVTVPANSSRVFAYDMTFETCAVGSTYSIDNVATAKTGTVIIGSGSATQSNVNIAGNCGQQNAVVTVTDQLVDPVPATGSASSITTTAASLAGTVDPNSQSGLAVRFIYSTNSNLSSPTAVTLSDTSFVADPYGVSTGLTGLSGSTVYYYAVQVEDPDDSTAWISGGTRSFTTDPVAATVSVETNNPSSISTTSAVLNGRVDANGVSGGAKVKFEWATDSSGGSCTSRGGATLTDFLQSEDGSGGTEDAILTGFSAVPMTYALTGLTANTDYCYRIIAYDSSGYTSATNGSWVAFTSTAKTAQTISWSTTADPLPAGGTTEVEATATSGLPVTYTSADTSICTVNSSTGAVEAQADSGTCSITASQSGNSTYYAAIPVTTSFAILPPVVTPQSLVNGAFQTSGYSQSLRATGGNGTYSSWTVSSGSLPSGLTLGSSTGVISGTPTAAGVFTFAVTVVSNTVTSAAQSFTITITKKTVTVTASSPSVAYGAAAPTITPSYIGFVGSDVTTVSTSPNVAPTCTSTYTVGQNAGTTATTSCSGGSHENYTYTYVTGSVTVTKFPVTITALDAAKQNVDDGTTTTVYADPTLRWVATSPLPAGETIADVVPAGVSITRASSGTTPGDILNTSLPAGEAAGTFTITPSGTAGSNYDVTFATGTFTIQNPLQVPSLSVSDKTMTYGDSNTAAAFIGGAATNRSGASVSGTYAYSYVDSEGNSVTLDDLSTLDAGTYTVQVAFTATDGTSYYKANPVIETMVLTVEKKAVTVTAADKKKLVGALDPGLTWSGSGYNGSDSDSALAPITITRSAGETAGSYSITTTGGDTPNYAVTHVPGTFYIYEPVISVAKSRGVLTSRTVQADCRGAKVGASATFSLITNGTSTSLGTTTVGSDGTCPITTTLDSTVPQGAHTLKIESTDPLNAAMSRAVTIILLASQIEVISNSGGSSSNSSSNRAASPLVPFVPRIVPPGLRAAPAPVPATEPSLVLSDGEEVPDTTAQDALGQTRSIPRLPGRAGLEFDGFAGLAGDSTIDVGQGIKALTDNAVENSGRADGTQISGLRTIGELAEERLGGFQPGVTARIEVLGARSGARFVATEEMLLDTVIAVRAIQNSVPAQAADFFALESVRPANIPPEPEPLWSEDEREAVGEFFEASGLDRPISLADLDTDEFTRWVQVSGSASTYLPGSVVFLTLTSQPLVLSSAVVGDDGRAVLTGSLPLEWLSLGEHRVRLVGIRALDGVTVDSEGQVQVTNELLQEIQRFDLGTQSTIAVVGSNSSGASHVALRVIPLIPTAPWWTLIFIGLGLILFGALRRWGPVRKRSEHLVAAVVVLSLASPAVILGWLSTVTAVTWWGLGLGLVATVMYWLIRPKSPREA